jgi:hypothetical protein
VFGSDGLPSPAVSNGVRSDMSLLSEHSILTITAKGIRYEVIVFVCLFSILLTIIEMSGISTGHAGGTVGFAIRCLPLFKTMYRYIGRSIKNTL